MKFEVRNRFTGSVQFTAEIDSDEGHSYSVRLGLAVRWAFKTGADLRDAYLRDAYLSGAYLSGADLSGADLRDADLRDAYLRDAYLSGAYLSGAYLSGAYLSGADLRDADLRDADLSGAYLSGAYLSGAYLRDADLRDADLRDAYLSGAYLRGAYLRGAYLSGLILLARAIRGDGYEYFAWTSGLGGMVITAGCRTWQDGSVLREGGAIADAREHCRTVTREAHRKEALRIVDFIEAALMERRNG